MKQCTKCLLYKQPSEYFVRDASSGRLHAQCKGCYKEHRRDHYQQHYALYGDAYRDRAKRRKAQAQLQARRKLFEYMSGKHCELCTESDVAALDFDHLDPSKKSFGIAKAVHYGYKWSRILDEIQKCRILCANCHRKHTAKQNGWYKNMEAPTRVELVFEDLQSPA